MSLHDKAPLENKRTKITCTYNGKVAAIQVFTGQWTIKIFKILQKIFNLCWFECQRPSCWTWRRMEFRWASTWSPPPASLFPHNHRGIQMSSFINPLGLKVLKCFEYIALKVSIFYTNNNRMLYCGQECLDAQLSSNFKKELEVCLYLYTIRTVHLNTYYIVLFKLMKNCNKKVN